MSVFKKVAKNQVQAKLKALTEFQDFMMQRVLPALDNKFVEVQAQLEIMNEELEQVKSNAPASTDSTVSE